MGEEGVGDDGQGLCGSQGLNFLTKKQVSLKARFHKEAIIFNKEAIIFNKEAIIFKGRSDAGRLSGVWC